MNGRGMVGWGVFCQDGHAGANVQERWREGEGRTGGVRSGKCKNQKIVEILLGVVFMFSIPLPTLLE